MHTNRKWTGRRIVTWILAVLLLITSVDISGWGSLTTKAEETRPREVTITKSDSTVITVIQDGKVIDGGIKYQTWYYYETGANFLQIINNNIDIDSIRIVGGDLRLTFQGESTVPHGIEFDPDGGNYTLSIGATNNNGTLNSEGAVKSTGSGVANLVISNRGFHMNVSEIYISGNLQTDGADIITSTIKADGSIDIENSYIEAKTNARGYAISAGQGVSVKESQIVAESRARKEDGVISSGTYTDSVITKRWKESDEPEEPDPGTVSGSDAGSVSGSDAGTVSGSDAGSVSGSDAGSDADTDDDTGIPMMSIRVYGEATLKQALTIADGEGIDFETGAKLTNPELLTLEEGSELLVNGELHTHNTEGEMRYLWQDPESHRKGRTCLDCPLGVAVEETEAHHFNAEGFCVECDAYTAAVLTTDRYDIDGDGSKDSVYEIGTAGQLYWFAGLVNGTLPGVEQNTSANGVLVNDITVNENVLINGKLAEEIGGFRKWTPIGKRLSYSYEGKFDGQNHTVKGLYYDDPETYDTVGFIGVLGAEGMGTNAVVKNLTVDDFYFLGSISVGGMVGCGEIGQIINCSGHGIAIAAMNSVGGICGVADDTALLIRNCYFSGTVSGGQSSSIGEILGTTQSGSADAMITNCYYLSDTETDKFGGTTAKTAAECASGEVAYLLQGDQTEAVWGQKLGNDSHPVLGGMKVYPVIVYEGCIGNPGEPVIVGYSNTEEEADYGEHTDADDDGRCDACGALIDGVGANLAGYTLSLNGNIGVNFYMELSEEIIADKDAYMQFILPNGTVTKVPVSEAATDTTVKEGTTYYVFSCEVASYEMTREIKAQMFDGAGNCGREYAYTVREYAQYLVEHESQYGAAYADFAIAMLNYGACSQQYFDVAVEDLANKNLTQGEAEIQEPDSNYLNSFVGKKAENEVLGSFAGISLVLQSETKLNIFYEPKEGVDVSKLTFLVSGVDGNKVQPVKRGQYYILSLPNIKAHELGSEKTFMVTDGTNTLTGDYCAMMYCYQVLNAEEGTYPDELVTLVKAFSWYAYRAQNIM